MNWLTTLLAGVFLAYSFTSGALEASREVRSQPPTFELATLP